MLSAFHEPAARDAYSKEEEILLGVMLRLLNALSNAARILSFSASGDFFSISVIARLYKTIVELSCSAFSREMLIALN